MGRRRLEETPACSVRRKARALVPRPRPLSVPENPARPQASDGPGDSASRSAAPSAATAALPASTGAGGGIALGVLGRSAPHPGSRSRHPRATPARTESPPRPGSEQTVWPPAAPAGSASASDDRGPERLPPSSSSARPRPRRRRRRPYRPGARGRGRTSAPGARRADEVLRARHASRRELTTSTAGDHPGPRSRPTRTSFENGKERKPPPPP